MDVNDSNTIEALRSALGTKGDVPFVDSPGRYSDLLVVHKDAVLVDAGNLAENPERVEANLVFSEIGSLIDYVEQFRTPSSRAFVDRDAGKIRVVLDYHAPLETGQLAVPQWCTHQVWFQAVKTKDWMTWIQHNEKPFKQMDWVEFLQDNIRTIVEPDGSDLMSMCVNLESKKTVNFKSSVKVNSGLVRLTYEEEDDTKGGASKGQIEIPSIFKLGIEPFEGCDAYALHARLKYRISDGVLSFRYRLDRPDLIWNNAMKDAVETFVAEMQDGEGKPPFPVHQIYGAANFSLPEREMRFCNSEGGNVLSLRD